MPDFGTIDDIGGAGSGGDLSAALLDQIASLAVDLIADLPIPHTTNGDIKYVRENSEYYIYNQEQNEWESIGTNLTNANLNFLRKDDNLNDVPNKALARQNLGIAAPVDAYTKTETDALLDDKANVVDVYSKTEADTLLNNKVDKVSGKGLSTNDFDNTYKSDVDANTTARHTHANKTLLDSYTQIEVDLADAVSKKHSHSNKTILDNTQESFTTALKTTYDNYSTVKADKANVLELDNITPFTPDTDYEPSTKKYVDDGLALKLDTSLKGAANGLAELDENGLIPSAQLPSFVDDVLEYNNLAAFPATGETGKIYVAKDTNITYRWGGSSYVEISASLALGETSSTAYRGDRGKTAYDHSQITTGNPHGTTKSDIGLGNVSDDLQLKAADLDTDNTLSANSDTKIASQKAVKSYVDGKVSTINSNESELTTHKVLTDSATLGANDRVVDFNGASGKTIELYTFSSVPAGRRYVVEINNFSANSLIVDLGSTTDTVVAYESVCYKLDSVGDWSVL